MTPAAKSKRGFFTDGTQPAFILFFLVLSLALTRAMVEFTHGRLIYPLDDTYIGMAMAKNLAAHGVWGVTRHEFTSSTSTPLFVGLLALCYKMTGVNDWWPLILSSLFGAMSFLTTARLLRNELPAIRIAALSAMLLLVPMHVMAVIGMEHSLHIALSLVFLDRAAALITGPPHALDWRTLAVTSLMVACRYEGVFAVGVLVLLLLFRRRPLQAFSILIAALLPMFLYGLFSTAHGWYWFPNSLLLKGKRWDYSDPMTLLVMVASLFHELRQAPWMITVFAVLGMSLFTLRDAGWSYGVVQSLIVFCTGILHLVFARTGWVFRYEAYLIAMAIVASGITARDVLGKKPIAFWVAAGFAVVFLCFRTVLAMGSLPVWSASIYSQQYQAARFLMKYHPNASVAANDIGAINYMNDLSCLDLVGLADLRILQAKRGDYYTTELIASEAARRNVQIGILYDEWFTKHPKPLGGPPVPANWRRVARWKVPDFGILGSTIVSFYAVEPSLEPKLREELAAYSTELPDTVTMLQ